VTYYLIPNAWVCFVGTCKIVEKCVEYEIASKGQDNCANMVQVNLVDFLLIAGRVEANASAAIDRSQKLSLRNWRRFTVEEENPDRIVAETRVGNHCCCPSMESVITKIPSNAYGNARYAAPPDDF